MSWPHTALANGPTVLASFVSTHWKGVTVPAGAVLLVQGDCGDATFLVARGLVKLFRTNSEGRAAILGLRGEGCCLGLTSSVLGMVSTVTATTLEPSLVHAAPTADLRRSLCESPGLAMAALEYACSEIGDLLVERAEIAVLPAGARLEHFLSALTRPAKREGADRAPGLRLPLSMGDLAQYLAITPQYLSELVTELESRGVIRRSHGRLLVVKPDALRHSETA